MRTLLLITALAAVIVTGCGSSSQSGFIKEARNQPTSFRVSYDSASVVWARAHDFLSRYSKAMIALNSTTAIATEPATRIIPFSYKVMRADVGSSVQFTVTSSYLPASGHSQTEADDRAGALAYYMRTGMPPPSGVEF